METFYNQVRNLENTRNPFAYSEQAKPGSRIIDGLVVLTTVCLSHSMTLHPAPINLAVPIREEIYLEEEDRKERRDSEQNNNLNKSYTGVP